eukprot:gene57874-biopygen10158
MSTPWFLTTPDDGLGQHIDDPDNPGHCLCKQLYGEVDKNNYLRVFSLNPDAVEGQEGYPKDCAFAEADAHAMGQIFHLETMKPGLQRNSLSEMRKAAEDRAGQKWIENDKRAPWGCKWFEKWKANVDRAVLNQQKLVVYYFRGQKGHGKVTWEDLANPDRCKMGVGLGGSQKAEVAYLDRMVASGRPGERGKASDAATQRCNDALTTQRRTTARSDALRRHYAAMQHRNATAT